MDMTSWAAIYFSLSPARDFPRNFARKSSNNCQCYCKKKKNIYIYIYIYCCPRAFVSLLSETARDGYAWDARFEETLLYVTVLLNYIFTYFRSKCLFEDEYVWRRDRVVWKRIRSILMFILFNSIVKRCFNVFIIRIILHSRLKLLKRLRISSPLPRFKTFYA